VAGKSPQWRSTLAAGLNASSFCPVNDENLWDRETCARPASAWRPWICYARRPETPASLQVSRCSPARSPPGYDRATMLYRMAEGMPELNPGPPRTPAAPRSP
jgi:hypothetical protein